MAERIPALVNPAMLKWAREEAGYSPEAAAEHAKVPVEKLLAWETGEMKPTLRQAEGLAAFYHCAYSVFCLSVPPATTPLAAECRRLPGVAPGEESPELRLALRQMLQRRRLSLWLTDELGEEVDPFKFEIRLSESPETVAARLREALGVSVESQKAWRDEFHAWRVWREAVERAGVLVFQFSRVPPEEIRGLCILDFPAPVIGVNSKEIPGSKPFTLLHELVHLALANAREELPALQEQRLESEWSNVERFVEEVAGAVLLPRAVLQAEPLVSAHLASASWSLSDIRGLAKRYKVTPLAMITRLSRIGKCDAVAYREWKIEWDAYLKLHPPKDSWGIATPAQKAVNRNGQPFTRLVLEALTLERITSLDAARYLDLRYPHVEALRRDLAFGVPTFPGEEAGAQ
jgi:Zn-dependent peptidase ImmA (M78 family)/DNA-binding XRE family transcriptional regulator